ncbi:MAG: hypothetical protein AW06_001976 [Candidatus Accumulibacter cognatus]|uniref:Uncharacterized protein n=1 Tax=Candidatus Accumulibacter cognatus TaxID=2954383 RepID=A0A080M6S3_9PROT|nr:MAG: hypothetical protein AW06_001976 [Candidatus Accumulibacter cognatus]
MTFMIGGAEKVMTVRGLPAVFTISRSYTNSYAH